MAVFYWTDGEDLVGPPDLSSSRVRRVPMETHFLLGFPPMIFVSVECEMIGRVGLTRQQCVSVCWS